MNDNLSQQQIDAILKALDDAIENGPWEESNFLRVIGKNLREIREKFNNQVHAHKEQLKDPATSANRMALRSGQQEVFIALYSTDGSNLHSWERILVNLPKQMISRPIYGDEQDVKEIIRTKENKINEAYVSIYVNQNDILLPQQDKIPLDKLGKPLLALKDKAILLENIHCFVHATGSYKFHHGRLTKNVAAESE